MVTVGLAVTVAPVVALSPVAGAQVYVLAPLAVMLTDPPTQYDGAAGLAVTTGTGLTVTVTATVLEQPPDVPVTV